jgi:hypothetical protein
MGDLSRSLEYFQQVSFFGYTTLFMLLTLFYFFAQAKDVATELRMEKGIREASSYMDAVQEQMSMNSNLHDVAVESLA